MQQDPNEGLSLYLLNIPKLYWQGEAIEHPSPKVFAMLCYLASKSEAVTRHELAELLWQPNKTTNVRVALNALRQLPHSKQWFITEENFVRVEAYSDVRAFKNALKEKHFNEALDIWHSNNATNNNFLKGLEVKGAPAFNNWLEEERAELNRTYCNVLEECIERQQQAGDYKSALQNARKLLAEDTLNEAVQKKVILLEYLQGNTTEAIEQFESYRNLLKKELAIEPSEGVLALLKQVEQAGGVSQAKSAVLIKQTEDITALPSKLIGRDELLITTHQLLADNQRVLLHGFGGAGKTALAATVAANHLSAGGKPLWLQMGNDDIESIFNTLAHPFEAQRVITQAVNKSKTIYELLNKEKISLLILDDVWNVYSLGKLIEAIPPNVALLVTSRQRYSKFKRVDVGYLERHSSLELLGYLAEKDFQTDENADKLCEVLSDHAFALRVAGINLAVDNLSPEELLKQIINSPHDMKMPTGFAEEGRESFASLLDVSLQALSDEAYEAFLAMGVLFTPSCTPQFLSLCLRRPEEETENALMELQRRALAERITSAGSDVIIYDLHDLAFSFARANKHIRLSTLIRACHNFVKTYYRNFGQLEADLNNILSSIEAAQLENDIVLIDIMKLLVLQGNSYYANKAHKHTPRSLKLLEAAATAAKRNKDFDKAHYFKSKLGDACQDASSSLEQALSNYQEALELAQIIGDTHREAISMSLVGLTYFQSDLPDEENYLQKAYELAKNNKDDFALDQILQHRKLVAERKKDFELAYKFCLEAVEVTERILGQTTTDYAKVQKGLFCALLHLGEAEKKLGHVANAQATYERALQLAELKSNQNWLQQATQAINDLAS